MKTTGTARIFAVLGLVILTLSSRAASAQGQVVDRTTLTNKVMVGYQGWHMCPGDGNDPTVGWNHWIESGGTGPGYYHCDIWPDTTEYNSSDLFSVPNTTLTYGGTPYLYSDYRQGSTNVHWRWMMENGIDGAFVQRFLCRAVGNPYDPYQKLTDQVLRNELNAASTYGRTICLEWDISGVNEPDLYNQLTADWTYLKTSFNIKNHPRYLYHNGKPVVIIWGLGFQDRPGTPQIATDIANYFKNDGCFVMVGVPGGWRTRTAGSKTDPAWDAAYRSFNGITPWTVGGYKTWTDITNFKNTYVVPDLADCNSHGILYMTTSWPRFEWDNMNHLACGTSHFDSRGGQHLWDQIYAWKGAGVGTQFIAMMDEYDEGTAIMKCTDNVPIGACWMTTEGKGNDWFLRLANQASKMQRGEFALTQTMPIASTNSPDMATIISENIPTTMNAGQQYSVSVTVQNTGETTWSWEQFKLGTVGDSDPFATSTRFAIPTGTAVTPGQQVTFSFTLRAPTHAGTYATEWRMCHELVRFFGARLSKIITVGAVGSTLNNSGFTNDADGWSITTWKAGTSTAGTMTRTTLIGNPGYAMRCAGYSSTDNSDRCAREGAEIAKTISTVGYKQISVSYDLRVNTLGNNPGTASGSCTVDHNLLDEQLTVFYSTNGGTTWTEADWIPRQDLKAGYMSYGTRAIDLSGISACDNNANFRLRFRWQLNTSTDNADLDNIRVYGNIADTTPPGPVTNFLGTPGNRQIALTWTNPSAADFTDTVIRYRTDAYPTSVDDGALVADEPGSAGANDTFFHTGLANELVYYYAAFAHDDSGLYSTIATTSATPEGSVGDWINETFDTYPDGNLMGSRWLTTGLASAQVESALAKGGTGKAALMDSIVAGNPIANEISFTDKTSGYVYLSFDVCEDAAGTANQTIANVTLYGADSGTEVTQVQIQKGRLMASYGSSGLAVITMTAANLTWYNVKLGLNISSRMMDLWLDGVSKGTGYAWKGTAAKLSRVVISCDRNSTLTTQKAYIDNLRLEAKPGTVTAVNDDGAWTPSLAKLHFSFDSVPGTTEYRYAIGTTSNGTQTRTWTSCGTSTDVIATGLSLAENTNYYITVQCANQYGTVGSNKSSDGIKVAPALATILDAKALADGTSSSVKALRGKIVTVACAGYFYVQEPDFLTGLKVLSAIPTASGDQVDVCGIIKGAGAERYLDGTGDGVIKTTPGPGCPDPVALSNAAIGGVALNAYAPGLLGGSGPNNIGLLVTTWGKVTQRDPANQFFYIDDGSGLRDGTSTGSEQNVGVRVIADPTPYPSGSYVTITGVVSTFTDNGLRPKVLPLQITTLRP
jgi:hypothetical protein